MLVNAVVLVMTILVMTAGAQRNPELKSHYFDGYNDSASIAYDGGYIELECVPHRSEQCDGVEFELEMNGTVVDTRTCDVDAAVFRLNINENLKLGAYRCRSKPNGPFSNAVTIDYRLCSNRESSKANCPNDQFCMVKNDPGMPECTKSRPNNCNAPPDTSICPADDKSLCHSIPKYDTAFAKFHKDSCPNTPLGTDFAKIRYNAKEYRYGEPIPMQPSNGPAEFHFNVHDHSTLKKSKVTCTAKKRDGGMVEKKSKALDPVAATLEFEDLFKHGTDAFKMLCEFTDTTTSQVLASLANDLVVPGPTTVTIEDTGKKGSNGEPMMRVVLEPSPSADLLRKITWLKDNKEIPQGSKTEEEQKEQEEQGPGEYEVMVTLVYYSAAPARKIPIGPLKSTPRIVKPKPTSTRKPTEGSGTRRPTDGSGTQQPVGETGTTVKEKENVKNGTGPPPRKEPTWWDEYGTVVIVVVVVFGVILVAVVVGLVVYLKKRNKRSDVKQPDVETGLQAAGEEKKPGDETELQAAATAPETMNEAKTKVWALDRIKKANDLTLDDELKKYDQTAAQEEDKYFSEDAIEKGQCIVLEYVRHEIALNPATLVICKGIKYMLDGTMEPFERKMPINRMKDYHGNDYMIAMAPIQSEFFFQWKTIYQENVGVLAWVGETIDLNSKRVTIDPYVPLEYGAVMTFGTMDEYGKFTITAGSAPSTAQGCVTILLDIVFEQTVIKKINGKLTTKTDRDMRRITFLHFKGWPDFNIALDPQALINGIEQMANQQKLRAEKGFPAVMVHCSMGVQRSVSLTICYFGLQMCLSTGYVNPMAILRYIRRRRWYVLSLKALRDPIKINQQMAMVAAVLRVICTRTTSKEAGDHERALTGGTSILMQLGKGTSKQPLAICPVPAKGKSEKKGKSASEKSSKPGTTSVKSVSSKGGPSISSRK